MQNQLHLIFINQVISLKNKKTFILFFSGLDKPQAFIPLDIDRQVDGKLIIGNHINVNPPNGRLPMAANHVPNTSIPLPSHPSQHQLNPVTPAFMLDGGVYQGQPPTTQLNDWNLNTKVKGFFLIRN